MSKSENHCDKPKKNIKCKDIYRIISFQRVIDMLAKKKNYLVEPYRWDDPLEGWLDKEIVRLLNRKTPEDKCNRPGKFFGQCWTTEYKREHMWQIYSRGVDGVRIKSTIKKLEQSVNKGSNATYSCVKLVEYKNFSDSNCLADYFKNCNSDDNGLREISVRAQSYMIKREGFIDESEVRLICFWKEAKNENKYFPCQICPNTFIKQIMIHPRTSDSDFKKLKRVLRNYGFENEIKRSELYSYPDLLPNDFLNNFR